MPASMARSRKALPTLPTLSPLDRRRLRCQRKRRARAGRRLQAVGAALGIAMVLGTCALAYCLLP